MPQVKPDIETFAKIKVVGVGGSGGAAIDRMVQTKIRGVEFIAMNTDVQALHHNSSPTKLHIGKTITRGLGAGMDPELGKRSAEETQNEMRELLKDTDMVFITCGLGGGTGSGASPVVAEIARDMGVLTVAVVTKPFSFEGPQRKTIADKAHNELVRNVDTVITIPNDRILQIIDNKTSLVDAFKIVDDVLRQGVQGISELITVPGLINVDFADVKTIMSDTGSALMGIGVGKGEDRAVEAAKAAISSPLLEISIDGARGVLFTITGGPSLGMQEVAEAAKVITTSADDDAKVIFGAVIDEEMGDEMRISVIATGFDERLRDKVKPLSSSEDGMRDFGAKKPLFKSTLFSKRHEDEDQSFEDIQKPQFTKRSVSPSEFEDQGDEDSDLKVSSNAKDISIAASQKNTPDDEEDLEIPAFIRKKMGM